MDSDREMVEDLLKEAEERVREEASVSVEMQGQIRFSIWVSYAEIYNEYVYDLLEPLPKKKNAKRAILQLREDKHGVPYIKGKEHVAAVEIISVVFYIHVSITFVILYKIGPPCGLYVVIVVIVKLSLKGIILKSTFCYNGNIGKKSKSSINRL